MPRTEGELAYILHQRPYSDSRMIVDFFSEHEGRLSGLLRQGKTRRKPHALEPTTQVLLSWVGRSELKTITTYEISQTLILPHGKALFCGLYLNELIMRLLPQGESSPRVFAAYGECIKALASDEVPLELALRAFEQVLLEEIGYGFDFEQAFSYVAEGSLQSGCAVVSDKTYVYRPGVGFIEAEPKPNNVKCYTGQQLLQLAAREHLQQDAPVDLLRAAKTLFRQAIQHHLGGKPLKSRELFTATSANVISPS